ncbi:MAG: alpha/beta hydrolase [Desulfobacteraceae bacterium]|nr:alpha/beta hydrolase [Desulfobacteraceae bacterium]
MKKRLVLFPVIILLTIMNCRFLINWLCFFPDRSDIIPVDHLPESVQEIFIGTADGKSLQSYLLSNPGSSHILIYFHGNAGNIGHRLADLQILANMGVNVLGVSYRGYGKSTGRPNEKGIYEDGRACFAYAQEHLGFEQSSIILFGRSIGSTVAVNTVMDRTAAAVVLVTPMTSAKDVGKAHGYGPFTYFAGNAFDNLSKIKRLNCPLLIVHGTSDEIVPFFLGEKLFAAAPEPKTFFPVQNAGHNNLQDAFSEDYWGAIGTFIRSITASEEINREQPAHPPYRSAPRKKA